MRAQKATDEQSMSPLRVIKRAQLQGSFLVLGCPYLLATCGTHGRSQSSSACSRRAGSCRPTLPGQSRRRFDKAGEGLSCLLQRSVSTRVNEASRKQNLARGRLFLYALRFFMLSVEPVLG